MTANRKPVVRANGATGKRKNETCDSSILRRQDRTPSRPYRRPFPRLPFRRFYGWPEGLAYAVGLAWPAGRREAA